MKVKHYLYEEGDLTEVNNYLKSIGVTTKDGLIAVTQEQHRKVHELEGRRFRQLFVLKLNRRNE